MASELDRNWLTKFDSSGDWIDSDVNWIWQSRSDKRKRLIGCLLSWDTPWKGRTMSYACSRLAIAQLYSIEISGGVCLLHAFWPLLLPA